MRQIIDPYHWIRPAWEFHLCWPPRFWWSWWTPVWHESRGPYISIGLGVITIYRGY